MSTPAPEATTSADDVAPGAPEPTPAAAPRAPTTAMPLPAPGVAAHGALRPDEPHDRPQRTQRTQRTPRSLMPRSFRARLVLAFVAVVTVSLALVIATLPPLIEGYFSRQETQNLETRTRLVQELVKVVIIQQLDLDKEAPRPIVLETDPPTPSAYLHAALGTAQLGRARDFTLLVAHANVEIVVSASPDRPQDVVFRLSIPFGVSEQPADELLELSQEFTLQDSYWASGSNAPVRLVTVRLSEPSVRKQTIQTIVGVMIAAAGLALLVAMGASVLLAARLTDPIRRLTGATRRLEQGDLAARVHVPGGASPEVGELAFAFNGMAERLQETVDFIRRDRDRSRDFVADVSHELRTPIAALRTFNELMLDGAVQDDATRSEFLEQSRQQIERLDWLATNLLELSKLDSGLVALDRRPDDLRAVVESAVRQAEPTAERKTVELTLELPSGPLRLSHDPPRIGQVLNNLIGNAIKFTPAGGHVEVKLRPTDEGAELVVADTGVGIEADELPRVFERFYRGDRVQQSRAAGSGLGLSIVRSIVEMHDGRVTIHSTPGRGTEVIVDLPRDLPRDLPAGLTVSSPSTRPD